MSLSPIHYYKPKIRVRVRVHVRILAPLPRHPDQLCPPLTALDGEPSTV